MSSEQFQRHMEFIVEQHAKFEIAIAKLEQQNKENTANIAKLGEFILSMANYNQEQDDRIAAHDRQTEANQRQIEANERQLAPRLKAGRKLING